MFQFLITHSIRLSDRRAAVAAVDNRIGTDRIIGRGDVDRGAVDGGVGQKRALFDIIVPDRVAEDVSSTMMFSMILFDAILIVAASILFDYLWQ